MSSGFIEGLEKNVIITGIANNYAFLLTLNKNCVNIKMCFLESKL